MQFVFLKLFIIGKIRAANMGVICLSPKLDNLPVELRPYWPMCIFPTCKFLKFYWLISVINHNWGLTCKGSLGILLLVIKLNKCPLKTSR